MIAIASKGHFLGQIPHPMQRLSEMKAIFDSGVTSMQLGLSAHVVWRILLTVFQS
jgi:hypothetical protein